MTKSAQAEASIPMKKRHLLEVAFFLTNALIEWPRVSMMVTCGVQSSNVLETNKSFSKQFLYSHFSRGQKNNKSFFGDLKKKTWVFCCLSFTKETCGLEA